MKATNDIIELAKSLNADIEVWADSENSWVIEAVAPDEMEWVESGSVSLVSRWWTYDKSGRQDAMNDIHNRMKLGLQTEK